MLSLRNRFGIPGVISVIALVFAMFGGAYAATQSGAHHKKAKVIRGPRGPKGATGATGPAGPAGPAGAKGDKGDAGANGSNGSNGVSVTGVAILTSSPTCNHQGGTAYTSASGTENVCNGKNGVSTASGGSFL